MISIGGSIQKSVNYRKPVLQPSRSCSQPSTMFAASQGPAELGPRSPMGDIELDDLLDDLIEGTTSGTPTPMALSGCWSLQLRGANHQCTPGFVTAPGHFKNKFCERCRKDGLLIAADRVCLMTPVLESRFENTHGRTVWTNGVRVVNQTLKCSGAAVLIFESQVPDALAALAAPVPEGWLIHDEPYLGAASIRFIISKGTLVPLTSGVPLALRTSAHIAPSHPSAEEGLQHGTKRRQRDDDARAGAARHASLPFSSGSAFEDSDDNGTSEGTLDPPGILQPTRLDVSPALVPCDRHSLLSAHTALEQQITTALRRTPSGGWATPGEESDYELWGRDADELGALTPPGELSLQETRALSSMLPLLRLSSSLLRASMQHAAGAGVDASELFSTTTAAQTQPHRGRSQLPPRPSTASTLPPSPPSSRTSTADSRLCGTSTAGARSCGDGETVTPQLSSTGTQTPVRLDLPHLLLLVISAIITGGVIAGGGAIPFALWYGDGRHDEETIHIVKNIIMYVVCGIFFNIGVSFYVFVVRRLGFLDHRSARVLGATWFGSTYRRCCLLRQERYRVMDEGNLPIYVADKRANERHLKCLSYFLALCFLASCLGAALTMFGDAVVAGGHYEGPLRANANASGSVTTEWMCDRTWACAQWVEWTCACAQSGQSGRVHEWTCA